MKFVRPTRLCKINNRYYQFIDHHDRLRLFDLDEVEEARQEHDSSVESYLSFVRGELSKQLSENHRLKTENFCLKVTLDTYRKQ